MTDSTLGRQLRIARKRAGLTQSDVAKRLQVCRTSICAMETGTRHVRASELQFFTALYGSEITAIDPDLPTPVQESARKRVLGRVWRHAPDALTEHTLRASLLSRGELERMAATVLHLLIEQEQADEEAV